MVTFRKYVVKLGKKSSITFFLTDPEKKLKEDFVLVVKAKTHILNAVAKKTLRAFHNCKLLLLIKNIDDLKSLNKLATLQNQAKQKNVTRKTKKTKF